MINEPLPEYVIDLIEYSLENKRHPKDFFDKWKEFEYNIKHNLPELYKYLDYLDKSRIQSFHALEEVYRYQTELRNRNLQGPVEPVESRLGTYPVNLTGNTN